MQYLFISTLVIVAATFVSTTPMPQGGAFASQSIPIAINNNRKFATLSASSSCDPTTLPNACINGSFAQCVNNAFVVGAGCSSGLKCFSLPLVNSVGSSTTCTTPEDAARRMGFASVPELDAAIGNGNSNSSSVTPTAVATPAAANTTPAAAAVSTPTAGSIASKNIPLAIAENQSFKGLSATSPCDATTQPNACINGKFAQCVNGAFVVGVGCGPGLQCFALPLVNKPGTSVTCTTPDDAARRMQISVGQL